MEKKPSIKAMKLVREIRDAHHDQLKDKTWDERVAFYKQQAQQLHKEIGLEDRSGQPDKRTS